MDGWFRVGTVDVTTTILVLFVEIVGLFIYAADRSVLRHLFLWSDLFKDGEVWRALTWPIPNDPTIWIVFMLAIFWFFGNEVERLIGRQRFAWFLLSVTVIPGVIGGVLDLAPVFEPIFGFRAVELCVFLVFVAEYPFARFFFGIPAWAIGAVILGIEFIQLIGNRQEQALLFRVIGLVVAVLAARSFGLLAAYPWIPAVPLGPSGSGRPRPRKPQRRRGPGGRRSGDVVAGPWTAPRGGPTGTTTSLPPPPVPAADAAADQAELDALLDKISEAGMDGLTTSEKQRLNELSKRMRGPR